MKKQGWTELIFGSMYSGKSEELLRRLKRCSYANQKFQLFKPNIDNRYSETEVTTHDSANTRNNITKIVSVYLKESSTADRNMLLNELYKNIGGAIHAISISSPSEILDNLEKDTQVIGIDEIQFFDESIINVIHQLEDNGIRIICSGLDMFAAGSPFGEVVPTLACTAKYVTKLHGVCVDCGDLGYISYKLDNSDPSKIDVGSNGKYICLCETCAKERDLRKKMLQEEDSPCNNCNHGSEKACLTCKLVAKYFEKLSKG